MKKLNCIAHNIKKPVKKSPPMYKGAADYLHENRDGIVKLRRRGFTWYQIAESFQRLNIPINFNNLNQWQLRNIRQRSRSKFNVGDTVKPISDGKKIIKEIAKVFSVCKINKTMTLQVGETVMEVPMKIKMFRKI